MDREKKRKLVKSGRGASARGKLGGGVRVCKERISSVARVRKGH